jgi:uncharacterized protein YajQ (UPF0234 family)
MPSFDIACEVDLHELDNALNQARKEISTRFDFKNAKAEILFEKEKIKLSAADAFKLEALSEIIQGKMARRNISLKNIEVTTPQVSPTGHATQEIKLKQGLETEDAKKIQLHIRQTKLKVTSQIQERQVRVTGKNRDDLQAVIASIKGADFGLALTFKNFRD